MEFGELVEPETRAFWENYDDLELEEPTCPTWKWMDEDLENSHEVEPFENFYIIEGKQIFDFVNKTTLKGVQPICQLSDQKTAVYRFPEQNYVICLTEGNDLNTTGQITELLKPWLEKATHTTAFSCQPAYSYNTEKKFDKRCFVREICSSNANDGKTLSYVEPLEDCNIIHGIAAGVSSWRLFHHKSFACYAIYIDCPTIDSTVGTPILKLFSELGINCDSKYVFSYVNNSNLYI